MYLSAIFRKLWSAAYDVALGAKHLFDVSKELLQNESADTEVGKEITE